MDSVIFIYDAVAPDPVKLCRETRNARAGPVPSICDTVGAIRALVFREYRNVDLDIEDLRTFVEVADTGGVSPAARRLGISKSMVSRRLIRLEKDLGVQLLARTTRGAALTEAGITFREHAAKACAEIDIAKETILPAGDLRGRLRIAAPLTFGPTHFAPVLASLAQRHPELQVHASYTDRFVDLIAEGFDCAIRVGHLADSNMLARRVGWTTAKYVATPDYIKKHGSPETPEEFLTHEVVMQGTETWLAMDGDKIITLKPQGRFKADNAVALVAAALAGIGLAGVPDELIKEHLASGALVPVMTHYPPPKLGIYVIRPPGQHPARKIRVLTEMLVECFEDFSTHLEN
ncbi:putative transcriptional regulator, LysR family [Agrobacterium tomkonis CFBP 6623]|uniref:HTH-type transcriptional regulator TtuA n=1 Tax=Agrobacterium tomkonis CFBP 6623 TaxID=1183432 RepID=A0A1S7RP66_9HYPH|nr:putative transcriptional regulator, LysR family [Agrobacterium tomkonis CFBP 6623]